MILDSKAEQTHATDTLNIQVSCSINHVKVLNDFTANNILFSLFVEVLRPSQPNGVMSSAVSLPNRTLTGQDLFSLLLLLLLLLL